MNDAIDNLENEPLAIRPIPGAIFLDTCILDSQNYNYSSTMLKSFIDAVKSANVKYLLPDPTEQEVIRHIKVRSDEALKALDEARKKAPFLLKWQHFPKPHNHSTWIVHTLAKSEWEQFLNNFKVVRLDYSGVNIKRVMTWYNKVEAPFREGKKRKEFPDAFVIEMLSNYAQKRGVTIAVVSDDQDLKLACERFPNLLHFLTLPKLTELLLLDHEKINVIKASIHNDLSKLESSIKLGAEDITFSHSDEDISIAASGIESVSIWDSNIVAIGDNECTISFNATICSYHDLEWEDNDSFEDRSYTYHSDLSVETDVIGTAKAELDPKSMQIKNIIILDFDTIEVELTEDPR